MVENIAVLLLGSNINPRDNLKRCIQLLKKEVKIIEVSGVIRTKAVGSDGPDFLNAAIEISTSLSRDLLKSSVISKVENQLCRKRVEDKYAPRTIDIDIIIFNDQIVDENLWKCLFIAQPVSDLVPEINHPKYGLSLVKLVKKITNSTEVELVKDFNLTV